MSLGRFSEVGQKQKTEKYREEEKKRDQKLVIKMASYALQRHLWGHTQSHLGQKHCCIPKASLLGAPEVS